MAHIELKGITKTFGNHTALKNLNIDIADGEFFVLLGQTGAGKTTTLRLIAGLEKPTAGQIFIDGQDVADWGAAERDVALVLQQYSLYPRYTVRENLEFPLKSRIRRVEPAEIKERVERVAKTLRIEHLLDRKTDRLSGGEMQRVSIGRAIVRKPRVFLMDEPLSALDAKLREALRTELKNLQMNLGATFLFVTHDQIEAMSMGDKIGVLNNGQLVQTGTPQEIYQQPGQHLRRARSRLAADEPDRRHACRWRGGAPARATACRSAMATRIADGRSPAHLRHPPRGPLPRQRCAGRSTGARRGEPWRREDRDAAHRRRSCCTQPCRRRPMLEIDEPVRFSWNPDKVVLFDGGNGMSLRHAG